MCTHKYNFLNYASDSNSSLKDRSYSKPSQTSALVQVYQILIFFQVYKILIFQVYLILNVRSGLPNFKCSGIPDFKCSGIPNFKNVLIIS